MLLLVAAGAMLVGCRPQTATQETPAAGLDALFERAELEIVANDGASHTFQVYLAENHEQQTRGLMFVRNLPERTGMLFVYQEAARYSMWMKNTYIPLDIVFARGDGTVSSVIHDTQPLSLESLGAIEPVNYVLELNAGVARRLNIGAGSRLMRKPGSN
jgi:uncharacterized membrane protein (UPF0127 family)